MTGRRVLARDLRGLGVGNHVVNLSPGERLPAGSYFIYLRQGTGAVMARTTIIH